AAALLLGLSVVAERWRRQGPSWPRAAGTVLLAAGAALSDMSAWVVLPCAALAVLAVAWARREGRGRAVAWGALALGPAVAWLGALALAGPAWWGLAPAPRPSATAVVARLPGWFLLAGSRETLVEDLPAALRLGEWTTAAALGARLVLGHVPELALLVLAALGARALLRPAPAVPDGVARLGRLHLALAILVLAVMVAPWPARAALDLTAWISPPERLVPYANASLLVVAMAGLSAAGARLAGRRTGRVVLGVALLLVCAHAGRYWTYREHVLLKSGGASVVWSEMSDVWRYLRAHVAGTPTRVAYETLEGLGFLDGGTSNMTALSAQQTGLAALASWRLPTLAAVRRPPLLGDEYALRPLARLPETLRRWNCAYVVVWWPGVRETLADSGAFDVVHESPNRLFSVLRLRGYEPSWLEFERPARPRAETARLGSHVRFTVENPWEGNRAVLKVTYHPGWRLRANGKTVALAAVGHQIGTGPLPEGRLELDFEFRVDVGGGAAAPPDTFQRSPAGWRG
ncbi:MAG TPA: hypothetical protein VFX28_22405, partial [Methylomirabilota bacterium]|nr:hypothetical protein [Methylomirabilota bacterium]